MRRGRRSEKLFKDGKKTATVYPDIGNKKRVVLNPYTDLTLASKRIKYDNFIVYTLLNVHLYKVKALGYQYLQPAFYVFYLTLNKNDERKMYLCVIDEEVAIRLLRNLDINTHLSQEDLCKLKFAFPKFINIVKEKFPDAKIP